MKIRSNFVSNSSSSSFICQVCKEEASGWDMDLYEAEMFQCENGHTVCKEHAKKELEDLEDIGYVPEKFCPICSFDNIIDEDMVPFLLEKFEITAENARLEIKEKFKSYKKFMKHIKK